MDWNITQNFSSNIVFGILLFAMITYWINLSLFRGNKNLIKIGKWGAIIANILLFFILCSRWIVAGYFPLSNLYESLLFLTWTLLTIYLYLEFKTKSKLLGAILLPIALLINGFANLTLSADMQKSSPLVPALQSNWLMMHVSMMMLVLRRAEMFEHHQVEMEKLSTRERMSDVLQALRGQQFVPFVSLFKFSEGKLGVVVTFLAIMELIKESLVEIVQSESFGPIHVKARAS